MEDRYPDQQMMTITKFLGCLRKAGVPWEFLQKVIDDPEVRKRYAAFANQELGYDERFIQAKRLWDLGLPKQVYQATGEEEWNSFKSFLAKVPLYPTEEPKIGRLVLVTEVNPIRFMQLLGVTLRNCSDPERTALDSFSGSLNVYWIHVIDLRGPFERRWVNRSEVPDDYIPIRLHEVLSYCAQFHQDIVGERGDPIEVVGGFSLFTDGYGVQMVRRVPTQNHPNLPSPNVFVKRLT